MPATEEAIAELTKLLDEIVGTDPESLSRSDLGPFSLEDATPLFDLAISLFRDIHSLDLRVMPPQMVQDGTHWAREVSTLIQEAKGFDVEGSDPMSRRRDLIQRLNSTNWSAISRLGPYVSYLATSSTAAQEKIRELGEYADVKRKDVEQIVREAEVALESVKGIAGEAGVEQHSRIFEQQAKKNGATARRWLKAAGWLGAASAGWVFMALLLWPLSTATTSEAISSLGARFAILTLLLFGLGFALRQYASSKHKRDDQPSSTECPQNLQDLCQRCQRARGQGRCAS